ncbi:hypothetical protein [Undibacterium sp. Ji22W]|uniref:DUF4376 domain-containing protein n=1 Tax=Undibacterium sp. Ji22W TaxID=3413038 RepID=UPI003BF32FA5
MRIVAERATGYVLFAFADDVEVVIDGFLTRPSICFDVTNATHEILQVADNTEFVAGYWRYRNGAWIVINQAAFDAYKAELDSVKLAESKSTKLVKINEWRLQANEISFTFQGKHIAADLMSKLDAIVTQNEIVNQGGLPPHWIGKWKALDNNYVDILDVATWKLFHSALFNQGLTNFIHAQGLKEQVLAATTIQQVESINW